MPLKKSKNIGLVLILFVFIVLLITFFYCIGGKCEESFEEEGYNATEQMNDENEGLGEDQEDQENQGDSDENSEDNSEDNNQPKEDIYQKDSIQDQATDI